ncbi:MAG TPA: ABC transporter ATP-binding protein [Solirubrobacteraceae bacterium]|nr:ABC transporter ATP-binding protein [Solirubrobacteraceae bacterium]
MSTVETPLLLEGAGDHELTAARCAALEARAIRKSYGDRVVLDDASLSVHAGEAVAITGENGAGKSTLLRICSGLIRPDSGHVSVRGRVGFCPQEPGLFDLLSADEHFALFAPALGMTREQAIGEGHDLLAEFCFPTAEHTQCRRLSGGSRQKVNLALALLGAPSVLLLDEPYQGFDHGSYVSFWEHVARWTDAGLGVIVVTHLLEETALVEDVVDRVVEMRIARCQDEDCRQ